jgi:hypothetical protein
MKTREKVELALIAVTGAAAWGGRAFLPDRLPWGEVALYSSALLLGQSLVRDLYLKYGAPKVKPGPDAKVQRNLMCLESTIGLAGIVAGVGLLLALPDWRLRMPGWLWPALALGVGAFGFLIKDLVLDWRRGKIRVDPDHQNIIWW